jgi:hypothetical protein
MAKKLSIILVLVVLLGGLGVTLALLSKDNRSTAITAFPESEPLEYLIDFQGAEFGGIASVTVKNSAGEYTVLGGETAHIAGWESLISYTYPLTRIIETAIAVNTLGLVAESGANLAVYGLDNPRVELWIQPNQGDGAVLYIGNEAPDYSTVYICTEEGAVHQTGKWGIEAFLSGIFDFVDMEISPNGEDNGNSGFVFDQITLGGTVRPDGPVTVSYLPDETADNVFIRNDYHISGPIEAALNMEAGYNTLNTVMGLKGDKAVARVAGDQDLAPYGLDRPYSTVSVSGILGQGLGGLGLRASKPDGSGNVYVYREGAELVYQVAASTIPWLEISWWDLMTHMIIIPYIDRVAQVEINTPTRRTAFNLSGEGDNFRVEAQGRELNTAYFRRYYQTLLAAIYDDYTETKIPPGAQPFLEIVYRYRDDRTPDRIAFYNTDARRALASLNGGRPFYIFSSYTTKVLTDLETILQNQNVLPYL